MDDVDDIQYFFRGVFRTQPNIYDGAKIVNGIQPIAILAKSSILNFWLDSEYASISEISTFYAKASEVLPFMKNT